MKRKRIMVGVLLAAVLCVIAGGAFVFYSYSTRVYKHCMAEAGTEVVAEDFLKDPSFDIAFTEDSAQIDTAVPGDYKVKLRSGLFTYTCTLTIQDTVAPAAEVREVVSGHNEAVEAGDFVVSAEDETEVFSPMCRSRTLGRTAPMMCRSGLRIWAAMRQSVIRFW